MTIPQTEQILHFIVAMYFAFGFWLVHSESLILVAVGTILIFTSLGYFLMMIGSRSYEEES